MDAVDELIMAEVAGLGGSWSKVAVIDAPGLAGAAGDLGPVAVHCDDVTAEAGLSVPTVDPVTAVTAADLVLLRLPKSLAALDEWCELITAYATPTVRLVAGGRVKHLRHEMSMVLHRHFAEVHASLGVRKARVLHAAARRTDAPVISYPRRSDHDLDLPGGRRTVTLLDHGATFAHGRIDAGTRLLIDTAARWPIGGDISGDVVDLCCGDGILAVVAALVSPRSRVVAVDSSHAACASAAATATANDVAVVVHRADGLSPCADASADLIVCNPPFHQGTAKDSTPTMIMLADAGRVLRPGGELWTVFNAHLPYLPVLRRAVGRTTIAARNRGYLVTRTVRTGP